MDFNTILTALFELIHVGSAALWFGGGIYAFMLLKADIAGDLAVAARYNAQVDRLSKVGMLMPIAAMGTAIGGLLLYGITTYWNRGMTSGIGSIIFHLGVLAGLVATVHGAVSFGKPGREIKRLSAEAVSGDGVANPAKITELNGVLEGYHSMLNLHVGLVVFAFICMTIGSRIP